MVDVVVDGRAVGNGGGESTCGGGDGVVVWVDAREVIVGVAAVGVDGFVGDEVDAGVVPAAGEADVDALA